MTDHPYHPVAAIFPLVDDRERAALAADIAANGLREPILLHPDGSIIDGRNRHMACRDAGVEPQYHTWSGDGDLVALVLSLNLHRRHLSESQRAMVAAKVARLPRGGDRRSDQSSNLSFETQEQAANILSVSRTSVQTARIVTEQAEPELVQAVERGEVSVSAAANLASVPRHEQREIVARGTAEILAAAKQIRTQRRDASLVALGSSESNEWYTPSEYVEAARDVMGSIDLDPASCEHANKTVRASRIYTERDNGLSRQWSGNVWLNPPYGRGDDNESNQGRWSAHLATQVDDGFVMQACLLVNAVTDRVWFRPLWQRPICFVYSRIRFESADGRSPSPTHGNVIVYFGERVDAFAERFSEIGRVVIPRGKTSESLS